MSVERKKSILKMLDPPKGIRPWHGGPTLMGSLRSVDLDQAVWKPADDRHSIWELALHIAYWKYSVRRHLNPESEKGFGYSPSNWPVVDDPTEAQWKTDKQFIKEEHESLLKEIRAFPPERFDEVSNTRKKWTYWELIEGVVAHDLHHIGQIQLMKRLYKEMARR